MVTKDPDNDQDIILSLYDPLGYQGDNQSDVFLDLFASSLANKSNVGVTVINRASISCPKGLQAFSQDKKGYCSAFSLLWIYIIIELEKGLILDTL